MKLLTVVVSIVAALTANSEHFSDEYSVLQAQQLGESTLADVDGHEMYKPHNDLNKEKRGQNKTNPETNPGTCEYADGECMKKKTIVDKCNGNIDKNLKCGGKKDACCISDNTGNSLKNIENRINNLENSIESVINIVSNGSRMNDLENSIESVKNIVSDVSRINNLESSVQSVKDIVSDVSRINNLQNSVQSVKNIVSDGSRMNNLENSMNSMVNIITDFEESQECPAGFFKTQGSQQCFKYFNDRHLTWADANARCISQGLLLAKPDNPTAVTHYLVNTYGDDKGYPWVWVGAKGDGSVLRWQRNDQAISNTSPYWITGHPGGGTTTNHCICLLNHSRFIKTQPTKPYYSSNCHISTERYALCERV